MRSAVWAVGRLLLSSFVAAFMVTTTTWQLPSRTASVLVPAYFYPAGLGLDGWNRLAQGARSINIEAILNPASGPGNAQDKTYVAVVNNLRTAGGSVYGYVSTQYGSRAMAIVMKDITTYIAFYNINGIFIDEMANVQDKVSYYQELYNFIKQLRSDFKVIGNPGMPYTLEGYLAAADALVLFEGTLAAYGDFKPMAIAPWAENYPADRFVNIVYGATSESDLSRAIERSVGAHAASVFITDGAMPNPYQGLPRYWARELALIRTRNLTAEAPRK